MRRPWIIGMILPLLLIFSLNAMASAQAPEVEASDAAAPAQPAADAAPADEAPPAGEAEGEAETPKRPVEIHGSFAADADFEWADSDSDIDLDQFLRLKVTFPNHPRIRINAGFWLSEDLDSDEDRDSVLREIDDGYGSDVQARVLQLNVEIDDVFGDSLVRIGRQRILEGVAYNRIDGLYLKKYNGTWDWYVFGGARASLYEDTHNDATAGGGISWQIRDRTRVAIDAYYAEDDHDDNEVTERSPLERWLDRWYPRDIDEEIDNSVIALSVWHTLTENARLYGQFSVFDGSGDELTLNLSGLIPSWQLTYDLSYRTRLSHTDDRVDDITSYYRILGTYEEYDDFLISLHRPLTEQLTLSIEAQVHDSNEENEYTGNWDYERYAAILSAEEVLPGTDASVSLEYWDADAEEGWVVTGEATKRWEKWHWTVGADYEAYDDEYIQYYPAPLYTRLFVQDVFPGFFTSYYPLVRLLDDRSVTKRENIYSVYTKLRWLLDEKQDVNASVTYEEDDGDQSPYWRVRLGYAIRF